MTTPRTLFPAALLVVLAGAGAYFAGTLAAPGLAAARGWSAAQAAGLTWAVQLGFVAGTLGVVALDLPDRVRPGRLAAVLLVAAAAFNLLLLVDLPWGGALAIRFLAGATAGPVYPLTMRLLATWYAGLGERLGTLLAVYVLGVGTLSILKVAGIPWRSGLVGAALLAGAGAVLALLLWRSGPILPSRQQFDPRAMVVAFRVPAYRWSSFAYFGHMWELFAFWALLPFWMAAAGWSGFRGDALLAGVYVAGALGCLWAGRRSRSRGAASPARAALTTSGLLCLASPLLFAAGGLAGAAQVLFALPVLLWGAMVVADSPMFSALSAAAAPHGYVGSALTMQNAIGFLVPVLPLVLIPPIAGSVGWGWTFLLLAAGPAFGVPFAVRLAREYVGGADADGGRG